MNYKANVNIQRKQKPEYKPMHKLVCQNKKKKRKRSIPKKGFNEHLSPNKAQKTHKTRPLQQDSLFVSK